MRRTTLVLIVIAFTTAGILAGTLIGNGNPERASLAAASTEIIGGGRGAGEEIAPVDDYPEKWKSLPLDAVFDDWRMYSRECVSFVAWRLHSRNGYDIEFHDDATNWGPRAEALGYKVDDTPAIGAVAWKASGHVAWVRHIDGDTVYVEDYNRHYDGTYDQYGVPASSFKYIHFADIPAEPAVEEHPPTSLEVAAPAPTPEVNFGDNNGGDQRDVDAGEAAQAPCCDQPDTANPQTAPDAGTQGSNGGQGADPAPPTTAAPQPTTTQPPPPPTHDITVSNRVTNGSTQMREDDQLAYLSTRTTNYCRRDGCVIAGTEVGSGHVWTASCQTQGDRTTNGQDNSDIDNNNPGLASSTLWYGVRLGDGTLGVVNEVWIDPSQRGGLGLPAC